MNSILLIFLCIFNVQSLTTCDSEGPGYFKMFSKVAAELKPNQEQTIQGKCF